MANNSSTYSGDHLVSCTYSILDTPNPTQCNKSLYQVICSKCFNVMKAPIYRCNRGHCVCKLCRAETSKCPTCRRTLKRLRHVVFLLNMVKHVLYPCMNKCKGCNFQGKPETLNLHEESCSFSMKEDKNG